MLSFALLEITQTCLLHSHSPRITACLHHSDGNDPDPIPAIACTGHASFDLSIPRIRSCVVGVTMDKQKVRHPTLQPQPNLLADGTTAI